MRRFLTQVVVAAAMSFSVPALADGSQCPPGAWFCAEVGVPVPAVPPAPPAPARPRVLVVEEEPPPRQVRVRPPPPSPEGRPPPVVIYQPVPSAPPPQVIVITPGYGYGYGAPGYNYRPRPPAMATPLPPAPRWQSEWGLNLRVEGVALGHASGGAFNAGLGGVGMSLRYRPVPAFAFDLGADLLTGTDYNGFQRTETPLSLSGMLFLNPRSRAQFYLIAGANISRAEVRSTQPASQLAPVDGGLYGATYTYFGGQGGAGFEFRLSRRVALDLDGIAFVRKRTDGNTQQPEFTDPVTGQTTNTSAGGIFRGGFTFWW